jgi:predicted nucleic acid-binding protein
MIVDTNLLINAIRKDINVSNRLVIPIIVIGELEAFSLK